MDYIKYLRNMIGHEPVILCACGCIIFNKKGQVLLQRRSDDGLWGNPGGCMELGESIYDTVIREIKEETNISLIKENLKIFNIYSGEEQYHIYPNKDEAYFVNIMFETIIDDIEVEKDEESLDLKFFDLDKIPSNITDVFKIVKEELIGRNKE